MMALPDQRFVFGLARQLGMTVDSMLKSMSSKELAEWKAYFILENESAQQQALAMRAEEGLKRRRANRRR